MTELRRQFAGALLVILTVAAVISAAINFQQQSRFHLPEDGVTWMTRDGVVEALHVVAGSPADRFGLKPGDRLLQVAGAPVKTAEDVARILVRIGAWNSVKYTVERAGVPVTVRVVVGEQHPGPSVYYQYLVGLAYLGIGLFVYYRRGNAERARHFYVLCLASFVLSTFHYTGKLNNFDKVIYWGNVAAGLFAPTIFLHFTLAFPESRRWLRGR
ncbi:MAG: sensor signal transduction histidine kinase, partial [candidate division NC10 bacterium]|nr:sensor signal transduction histidine kinase [candidate division NC10 bacterium]